jgi:hypothetical protein
MVLAAPDPLLTPPPSSSPPKTPHRSYSAQTRSQNEEKNPPPQTVPSLQTRTRHKRTHRPHPMCKVDEYQRSKTPVMMLDSPHTSAPMLMRPTSPQTACGFLAGVHFYLGPHPRRGLALDLLPIQQTGRRLFCGPWLSAARRRVLSPSRRLLPAKMVHHRVGMCSCRGVA